MQPGHAAVFGSHQIAMCQGIVAMRSDVFDDIGGYDEAFVGWGAEDTALLTVLGALYPDGRASGYGETLALWHPDRHGTEQMTAANIARCTGYEHAAAQGRMREYLEEARRG